MENPKFVDKENVALVIHHEHDHNEGHYENYDGYNTLNTTAEEAQFKTPSFANKQPISTLRLSKEVNKRS